MRLLERLRQFVKRWVLEGTIVREVDTSRENINYVTTSEAWTTSWVRAALKRIADAVSSVSLVVYDAKGNRLPDNHPAVALLDRPNERQTTYEIMEKTTYDLLLTGNAYWFITERDPSGKPRQLLYVPAELVKPQMQGLQIVGYQLSTLDGVRDLSVDDVVHFVVSTPFSPIGESPIQAIATAIKLDREVMGFNFELFKNGAFPSVLMWLPTSLQEAELQRLREQIRAQFGRGQRHNWFIAGGVGKDAKIEAFPAMPKDMAFEVLRRMNREEILSVLGVPPALVGIFEYANYANSREQMKIFWRDTVVPLLRRIENTITHQLLQQFEKGLWCQFDLSSVEALKTDLNELSQALQRLVQFGILTINEAREIIGRDNPVPWGDEWWGPPTYLPLASMQEIPETSKVKDFVRIRRWSDFVRYQHFIERNMHDAVKDYADRLRFRLRQRLRDLYAPKGLTMKQLQLVFDIDEEASDLWEALSPHLDNANEVGVRALRTLFGIAPDLTLYDARVTARMLRQERRIRWISETTWERLREALAEGLEAGEGIEGLMRRVDEVIGELETWRGERIARTESAAALNGAFNDGMIAGGVRRKMWIAALDERTRPSHEAANGQIREVGEPFEVGSALLHYPGEPMGPPQEVINCRCTLVPVD
jgi:HK97 family phage portal protein